MHYPCEDSPYFVALQGNFVTMSQMPPEIGNDHVSAIKIPAGYAVQWYEHNGFGGQSWIQGHPTIDISQDLSSYLGNQVSSFKARKVTGNVKLYEHYYFGGSSFTVSSHGSWSSMPAGIGNDKLSSVYIPRGYQIELYRHTGFGDRMGTWWCNYSACILNLFGGLNDAVSSFKVYYRFE